MQKLSGSKKVDVVLLTSQKIDGQYDTDRMETVGEFFEKENSCHLLYQENNVKTHIRISGDTVHVHRLGELSGDLWFVKGDERDTRYETPYGRMLLTLDTHKLEWDAKRLRLHIRYNILSEGQLLSMNEMTIEMKERKEHEKSCK
ncbi:MAG: DUF1934 domain-containing protein [Clostridia bacterium]|nr:DUF1934 domain-containing protein [Clostridia bacterium]